MPSLEVSRATRRAAQLFRAWQDGDIDGILALVAEADQIGETMLDTVCGLLSVGSNLAKAAVDGAEDAYLADVLGASLVDELMSGVGDG